MDLQEKKASASQNGNEVELLTKEVVESLMTTHLNRFKEDLEKLFSEKIRTLQENVNKADEKLNAMEMDIKTLEEAKNKEIKALQKKCTEMGNRVALLEKKCTDNAVYNNKNEQYSRRNNFRVWGLDLSNDSCGTAVVKLVNNQMSVTKPDGKKFTLSPSDIEVAHIIPQKSQFKNEWRKIMELGLHTLNQGSI